MSQLWALLPISVWIVTFVLYQLRKEHQDGQHRKAAEASQSGASGTAGSTGPANGTASSPAPANQGAITGRLIIQPKPMHPPPVPAPFPGSMIKVVSLSALPNQLPVPRPGFEYHYDPYEQKWVERAIKPLPVETKFGEIIGHRVWSFTYGTLASLSAQYVWEPSKVIHEMDAKELEDFNLHKGFYAYKTLDQVLEHVSIYRQTRKLGFPLIIGRVKMWGDVVEHEVGFRAEKVAIKSLDTVVSPYDKAGSMRGFVDELKARDELLEILRKKYNVKEG